MMALEVDMVEAKSVEARSNRQYFTSYEETGELRSSAGESSRERSLVERLKAGDTDAFDAIFHQNVNQVYRRALRLYVLVEDRDRKSTRLNSSHVRISYAVFCLK